MPIPTALKELAERVHDPEVTETAVTRTSDGRWALLVQVRKGTVVPLEKLERMADGFAIVYEEEPDSLPIARPAYPSRGE